MSGTVAEGPGAEPVDVVRRALAGWTSELVELGGPNTLLWHADSPLGTLDLTTAHPSGVAKLLAGAPTRVTDLFREPGAHEDARRRARAIGDTARELAEERGLQTCFVALGMATWTLRATGDEAPRSPAAPVLLRACRLRPTDAAGSDVVLDLEPVVELNPALARYLATAHGVDLDPSAVAEAAVTASGFDPYPAYRHVTAACGSVPGFAVAPRVLLGTFPHDKLWSVADLSGRAEELARHDLVAAAAGDEGARARLRADPGARAPGAVPDPARGWSVLDADADQEEVADAVLGGSSLLVHGPPGTGKSQVVANLVANLAATGRRVLVVAEKRAALDTVLGRLDRVGLGHLVVDLTDGGRDGRALVAELVTDLREARRGSRAEPVTAAGGPPAPGSREAAVDEVRATASVLREHVEALHTRRPPWGVSLHEAQEAISRLAAGPHPPRTRVRLDGPAIRRLPQERRDRLGAAMAQACRDGAWRHPPEADAPPDPWFGAQVATDTDVSETRALLGRLSGDAVPAVGRLVDEVFSGLRLPETRTVADWGRMLDTVSSVRDTLEVFRPEVFDVPLGSLVAATAGPAGRRSAEGEIRWSERVTLRRQARRLLRPGRPPEDLHAALVRASEQREAWRAMAGAGGRPEPPADLDRARAAVASLADDLTRLEERLPHGPADAQPLVDTERGALVARLDALAAAEDRLAVLPRVAAPLTELEEAGLGPLVEDLARRAVGPEEAATETAFVWWASVVEEVGRREPALGAFDGAILRDAVERFAAADRALLAANPSAVRRAVREHVRRVLADAPALADVLEVAASRPEAPAVWPVRDAVGGAMRLATALRPCWLASPLTVPAALPPGEHFDVVVIDEASSVATAVAVPALSRARSVVVLGDDRQLPPAGFTTIAGAMAPSPPDGEATRASVMAALADALPARRLRRHYRSEDGRLVGLVDRLLYDGDLQAFPGTAVEPPLSLLRVDGHGVVAEGAGAVESTPAEVDAVVRLVLDHARSRPAETLGVVTLTATHAARVQEALRRAVADLGPAAASFFAPDVVERFFVKPVDLAQGDERDAVVVAVGFGTTPHGRVLHRFGALSAPGGEGRIGVALTRARRRTTLVTTLRSADLDPERLRGRGPLVLREVLEALEGSPAERHTDAGAGPAAGPAADPAAGAEPGSAVMAELTRHLRRQGLRVLPDVGQGEAAVELAVARGDDAGPPHVAVESDGPRYAALPSVRDRDRLRAEQLARRGWTPVRVWSTDVFRDPARDVEHIRHAATEAGS